MNLKEGDVILCKVKKIEKTTVFVDIEGQDKPKEGSLVLSEVAAGRIRNLRQYVVPNKKIVCKILNIDNGNIHLSLRRVTAREREEVLDRNKKEKNFLNILNTITNNPKEIFDKIKNLYDIVDFLEQAQENSKILTKFLSPSESNKLSKILSEKLIKEKTIKKVFILTSNSPSGLNDIKEILKINLDNTKIKYLGSSKFEITFKAINLKEADKNLNEILNKIEEKAKSKKAHFEIKEK